MRLSRIMHVETDTLDSIRNVGPGEGEILKSTSKTVVDNGVVDRGTITGDLGLCTNRCHTRLVVQHTSALQDIQGVLSLLKKQSIRVTLNNNLQKVVKLRTHAKGL